MGKQNYQFLDRTESCSNVPFLVGIMPLVSVKNAEFLHNEVPGMQIPEAVRRAMRAASGAGRRARGKKCHA